MKQQKIYITEDGSIFDNVAEAKRHEKEFLAKKAAKDNKINGLTRDDIIDFFSQGCEVCPFQEECDNMYNRIRCSTTDAFTLCSVIKNRM